MLQAREKYMRNFASFVVITTALAVPPIVMAEDEADQTTMEKYDIVKVFEDVCLDQLPLLEADSVLEKAANYGLKHDFDLGDVYFGGSEDDTMGLQLKPNYECVITTEDNAAHKKQLSDFKHRLRAKYGKIKKLSNVNGLRYRATVEIEGKRVVLGNSTKGGELLVVISPEAKPTDRRR